MAHRIKYKLLVWSTRLFMTLFWPTSLTSSCDIFCLTRFVPAIPTFLQFLPLSFFNSPMLLIVPQSLCTCCFPVLDAVPQLFRWHSDDNLKWLFLTFYQPLPTPPLFSIPLVCFIFFVMVKTLSEFTLLINLFIANLPTFLHPHILPPTTHTHTPEYKLSSLSISGI